jgi:hypothetical protein
LITAWKNQGQQIDGHALLVDSSAEVMGLVGLWAIRQIAGEDRMVVSTNDLAAFIGKAFEHKVSGRGLQLALQKSKGNAFNVEGTKFHITPTGIKFVEELIAKGGGSAVGGSKTDKNDRSPS